MTHTSLSVVRAPSSAFRIDRMPRKISPKAAFYLARAKEFAALGSGLAILFAAYIVMGG